MTDKEKRIPEPLVQAAYLDIHTGAGHQGCCSVLATESEGMNTRVDALLADYVMRAYRYKNSERFGKPPHLATCSSAQVIDLDARNGTYGCDTGCEYYRIEATIKCDHEQQDFEYGNFGELNYLIEDLEELEEYTLTAFDEYVEDGT